MGNRPWLAATDRLDRAAMTRPILIAGPTAAGKSALALQLAKELGGIIINADALQIYDCWQLLTARPPEAETQQAPHHLYGHVGRNASYSVGHWLRDVAPLLKDPPGPPIIIGGTGLYFMALTEGLAEIPDIPKAIRAEVERTPPSDLAEGLRRDDPESAAKIDMDNPARVRRASEVLRATGKGLAAWHALTPPPLVPTTQATCAVLGAERDWLNHRINLRFDQMLEQGVLAEVEAYYKAGWDPTAPSAQAIGAKELVAHLQGTLDLSTAANSAKTQTHQYAKRQRTWFRRRMSTWAIVDAADTNRAFQKILKSYA
ncbi:MAG: tRNA (adenosine(37)-N6)-dimethylallyltransferase MiaA [Pseudomonadota bacterium]